MRLINQTSSFSVARTNPKLTGNVKLTVDSDESIWLNSFDANRELSQDIFKRFPLETTSSYPIDLYKFFDNGNTPEDVVFNLKEKFPDPDTTSKEFEDQYDFFYSMGAQHNISSQYEEEYSYLAPLWLRDQIPDYFVIYRIPDSLDFPYNVNVPSGQIETDKRYKVIGYDEIIYRGITYSDQEVFDGLNETDYTIQSGSGRVILLDENKDFPFDIPDHFETILSKMELIKTFDLTENSKIGKYIRNFKNDTNFPKSPIGVRFEEQILTDFRGIGYREGVFTSKGEFLDDLWQSGRSMIDFEQVITEGFERQGIICANLLNLEFLFDDDTTELYDIPRYTGFYVSKNDIGSFQISGNDLYAWQNVAGNTEKPKRNDKGYAWQENDYYQTNDDGVRLFINEEEGIIPNSDEVKAELRSFYIQDKNGDFHTLDRDSEYGESTDFEDLIVKDTSLNLADFSGAGDLRLQARGELTDQKGRGYAVIKINDALVPNDVIRIYWSVGQLIDSPDVKGKYDEIIANDLTTLLGAGNWGIGSHYEDKYFHPYGIPADIASAIADTINEIEGINFTAFAVDDEVVIRSDQGGSFSNSYSIEVEFSDSSSTTIQEETVTNNIQYSFVGGTDYSNIRVIKFPLSDKDRLDTDNYLKTDRGLSRVGHIGRYVDSDTLEGFNTYATLYIEDREHNPLIGNSKNFSAFNLYRIPLGLFTFFNVKEIDGDFLDSTYGRTPENELYKYFGLLPSQEVFEDNKAYVVLGDGTIDFNGVTYPTDADNILFECFSGDDKFYTILSGDPIVIGLEYFRDADVIFIPVGSPPVSFPYLQIEDSDSPGFLDLETFDNELADFEGFETFRELTDVEDELQIPEDDVYWKFRDKFNYKRVDSEYDYLNENFTTEFSNLSRLVPFISKWTYFGGKDIRDNPYRLNTSLAFGNLNFSPSRDVRFQDPQNFTHEWYYLEKFPAKFPDEFIDETYSYFDERFDKTELKTIDPNFDYFLNYFTLDENDLTLSNSLQERFSIMNFNSETGFVEGLFRGVKIRMFERILNETLETSGTKPPFIPRSNKFDGYKFSSILTIRKPDLNEIESPVLIEIIEDKTHKNLTFLIELIISDYRINIHDETLFQDAIDFPGDKKENFIYTESKLDYTALYSIRSQRKLIIPTDSECAQNEVDDIKLSVGLDLSYPSGTSTKYGENWLVYPFDNSEYDWDLREEIHTFGIENIFTTENVFGHLIDMPQPEFVEDEKLFLVKFEDIGSPPVSTLKEFDKTIGITTTQFIIPSAPSVNWDGNPVFQIDGGKLFLEPIMQKISLAEIAKKINEFSPYIKYTSIEYVGETTVETEDEFYMEFLPYTTIKKTEELRSNTDTEKPQEFQTTSIIGYNTEKIKVDTELYRYSGPYEPKFRDLIFFEDQKSDTIGASPPIDLKFHQTKFNPNVTGFGILKNLNYLKIDEQDILTLSKSDKFNPAYPLIGETPIDQKDQYIFHSNWDPGFYQLHETKFRSVSRAGTREMKELKNYFASKVMKTRSSFRIEEFSVEEVETLEGLNLDLLENEIIFEENETRIKGILVLDKAIIRFLIEDGADRVFTDNIISEFGSGNTGTLDDDIEEYIIENVLPTYKINDLLLYVKTDSENLTAVVGNLTDTEKLANGYILNKNFNADKEDNFLFTFEYEKDSSFESSISISAIINKI